MKTVKQLLLAGALAFLALCTGAPRTALSAKSVKAKPSTGTHPVVYHYGCLVGGWAGNQWVYADDMASRLRGGEIFSFYNFTNFTGTARGGAPYDDVPGLFVDFDEVPQNSAIAVGAPWNALPRAPRAQSTDQESYKDEVARILKQNGLGGAPVKITQAVRMDLEGDGVEEAVISASNSKPMPVINPSKNDYTMVFLRKLVNGKVQTTMLEEIYYPEAADTLVVEKCRLDSVLDLNGDGVQELVVYCEYYEGDAVIVYTVDGGKVATAFSGGCGV